jgi:hypothetical protein
MIDEDRKYPKLKLKFGPHPQNTDFKVWICSHPDGTWGSGYTPEEAYQNYVYVSEESEGLYA